MDKYLGPSKQFIPRNISEGNGDSNQRPKQHDDGMIDESQKVDDDGEEDLALVELYDGQISSTKVLPQYYFIPKCYVHRIKHKI